MHTCFLFRPHLEEEVLNIWAAVVSITLLTHLKMCGAAIKMSMLFVKGNTSTSLSHQLHWPAEMCRLRWQKRSSNNLLPANRKIEKVRKIRKHKTN
jgi:hypothetical protein